MRSRTHGSLGKYQVVVVEQILWMARGVAARTAVHIQRDAAGEAGIAHGGRVVVGRRSVDVLCSVAQEPIFSCCPQGLYEPNSRLRWSSLAKIRQLHGERWRVTVER